MEHMDKRTDYAGNITSKYEGQEVTLYGWVQRVRNLGNLVFIDLRDREGIVQVVVNKDSGEKLMEIADSLNNEDVIEVKGKVVKRSSVNPEMKTGEVEVDATEIDVLNKSKVPPFEIKDDINAAEQTRLKYRYLDLRRPTLQRAIILRSKILKAVHEYFDEQGFIDIETPILGKSSPEGARDYLVPSRIYPGSFYALPQSPQLFKQLLMVSGMDRYFQIVKCFRDEDLRADRQPEFTQIDLEMSFVDVDDIIEITEGFISYLFEKVLGRKIEIPLQRLTYKEAMERYGSDKPDTRVEMEICDISDVVNDCGFGVFTSAIENGGSVRCITAKNSVKTLTRKEIDKLTEMVRGIGAKGLAYIRWVDEKPSCSFNKFITEDILNSILEKAGAEQGDVVLIVADKNSVTLPVLGQLRNTVAKKLDIIPEGMFNFLWITEFPFFEKDEETGEWLAMHHPFTMPLEECIPYLDTDPEKVVAKCYDLVLNGTELCSGSMRITDYELQQKMFESLGMSDEEIEAKFGFLVEAYKYGAPPHGGLGIGLDRLAMVMLGTESLRDVTAFPKVQNASELMSECPATVDKENLDVLGIKVVEEE